MIDVDRDRVVLDTDFIEGITSYQDGNGADLFRRVFEALGLVPVVHPYVAEHELVFNHVAQELIAEGALIVIPYNDFLPNDDYKKELYNHNFRDIHGIIKEENALHRQGPGIPEISPTDSIFSRHGKSSFGEVHSILMAAELGIPLFFSNDRDACTAAKRYSRNRLVVKNAEQVAELLRGDTSIVSRDERRFIGNYYSRKHH